MRPTTRPHVLVLGRLLLAGLAAVVLVPSGLAQNDTEAKLVGHPGYVDLGNDSLFRNEDLKVHVSIKDAMLRLVAAAARESEPELAEMMAGLLAIEVRAFDADADNHTSVTRTMKETATRLKRNGWDPAVDIRLDDAQGFLYFRFDGDTPVGLAGMFLEDGGEAVFLNIVGTIDPTLVGRLAAKFNISLLGEDGILPPADP